MENKKGKMAFTFGMNQLKNKGKAEK